MPEKRRRGGGSTNSNASHPLLGEMPLRMTVVVAVNGPSLCPGLFQGHHHRLLAAVQPLHVAEHGPPGTGRGRVPNHGPLILLAVQIVTATYRHIHMSLHDDSARALVAVRAWGVAGRGRHLHPFVVDGNQYERGEILILMKKGMDVTERVGQGEIRVGGIPTNIGRGCSGHCHCNRFIFQGFLELEEQPSSPKALHVINYLVD